jgi:hypothetical protein
MQEMPTIMDVENIHTPEYETNTTHIEEDKNPTQEARQLEEDVERIESDVSRGKGMQQEEHATDLTQ